MAHPNKFVSLNLNKSYGQHPSYSSSPVGNGRARGGARSGSGGGGGMVVLSRTRSSSSGGQKGLPKLSVPPPLNLPSLRKEHERFDANSARPRSSERGSGCGSSALGWTRPSTAPALQVKDGSTGGQAVLPGRSVGVVDQQDGGSYVPRGAWSVEPAVATSPALMAEKAVVLAGEDFPSLRATLVSNPQKKDALNKQKPGGKPSGGRVERPELLSPLRVRLQVRSSRLTAGNGSVMDGNSGSSRGLGVQEQPSKQNDRLPDPLPLVRLNHTSEWADDERDTGNCGFWRPDSSLVHAQAGSFLFREPFRGDSFGRDLTTFDQQGRNPSPWRTMQQSKHGFGFHKVSFDRNRVGVKPFGLSRQTSRDNSHGYFPCRHNTRDGFSSGVKEAQYARRDLGPVVNIQQNRKNVVEDGSEVGVRGRYGDVSSSQYRGDASQNSMQSKGPFSLRSKGISLKDPILNYGSEKRVISSGGKSYLDDVSLDRGDAFSSGLIGEVNVKVLKRKKDMLKQADFHDPFKESFEAEQERQWVIEEKARITEWAQRELEERERVFREEEKRRRLLEEEAREVAQRAEQERLQNAKRAEEQKISREEEKRRILVEEERRKEAAKQKLLELEARIARRQAEANLKDDRPTSAVSAGQMLMPTRERDATRVADVGDWEDEERMLEHTTSSASFDSLILNKLSDTVSSPHTSKDGNLSFMERRKHLDSWQKDTHDSGNNSMHLLQDQEDGYRSSRRDAFVIGRSFSRKEHYGGLGAMSCRPSSKSGMPEPSQVPNHFRHVRANRRRFAVDVNDFSRNRDVDSEFLENDKFGDGCSHGRPHGPYSERIQQDTEFDGHCSLGRSSHSLRQPRSFPSPPMRRIPFRSDAEHLSSSSFLGSNMRYQHGGKDEEQKMQTGYDSGHLEKLQHSETTTQIEESAVSSEPKVKSSRICDSQSFLSVSSPPSSSTHFSHDELDESNDRSALPTPEVGEQSLLRARETGDAIAMETAYLVPHGEDDVWTIENNEEIKEQEEYDEEDNVYQEDEEGHECGKNLDLDQESDKQQPDVLNSTDEMDQMILGFDEGIQVWFPNNDALEKASSKCEAAIGIQATSVSAAQESISDGGCIVQSENAFSEKAAENDSYDVAKEAEKALQDLVLDPEPSTNYSLNNAKATNISEVPAQQLVTSASSSLMPCASLAELTLSSMTTVATQAEVPLKLQFGLFSGPSLIPSHVPAIPIGSIQMPLHLQPQAGSSMTQMHSSQPPFFQFGQLRYAAPITQGILQLAPQTMPFLQPPASTHYLLSQNLGVSIHIQANQEFSPQNNSVNKVSSFLLEKQPDLVPKPADVSKENMNARQLNALQVPPMNKVPSQSLASSSFGGDKCKHIPASQAEIHNAHDVMVKTNNKSGVNQKKTQFLVENIPSQLALKEKALSGWNASGMFSGSKGKRFSYIARNAVSKSSFSGPESSRTVSSSIHRRPRRNFWRIGFRVRENIDGKQPEAIGSFNYAEQDKKTNVNGRVSGISARFHDKKGAVSNKPTKMMIGSEKLNSGASSLQVVNSDGKMDNITMKEEASIKQINSLDNEVNLKRNGNSEENVDAPLLSGVVCVFRQPGIEAPSKEDDFIQVRSKKQMLNDRREQREKEVKAKSSRVVKPSRKHRATPRNNVVISSSNKVQGSLVGDTAHNVHSETVISDRGKFTKAEISPVFSADRASQYLPPIGTTAVNVDADAKSNCLKPTETISTISGGGTKSVPGLSFENKNQILDNALLPFGSWDNADVHQQMMLLSHSQLDEAMKRAGYDSHVVSSIAIEPSKPTPSVVTQEKDFPSSTSSLNSLLAGEEIQFGAFTSPSILPPVSQCVSNRIGPSGSGRTNVSMECDVLATNNNWSIFFDKEKQPDEPCMHVQDPKVEAEAAASAAAISNNDEIIENRLSASSVSDSKTYSGSADPTVSTSRGMSTNQKAAGQSAAEESLSVALPADLSVDPPSLPLWPPSPNPQSTSGPMFSNLPGAPPSQFPCFEMNPTLAWPYFAFRPHEESVGTQVQPQKSTPVGSVPLQAWPQYHSNVDSFYGPPSGFSGPFISPGGIPGIPGPLHMVVYNHFTPAGQFGQVGLGFMGTTYIPTGKQLDQQHNTLSSLEGVSESQIKNLNVVSGRHNLPSVPIPIQHLVPGSPLMPMASPLAMFDTYSFQSSADFPMLARWSHIPAPSLYSVPLPVPLQQHQVEDGIPSEFGCSLSLNTCAGNSNRFNEPSLSLPAYGGRRLSVSKDMVSQFPDELTLVEPPTASTAIAQVSGPSYNPASANIKVSDSSKSSARSMVAKIHETGGNDTSCSKSGDQGRGHFSKPQDARLSTSSGQQYLHPAVIGKQRRSGASQNTGARGDWHRRVGHQGRNQTSGPERNFASSKME